MDNLAGYIDLALLKPDASLADVEALCREAAAHRFYAVSVHGSRVEAARHYLEASNVKVVAVVGFPSGADDGDVKRFAAEAAVDCGAHEIEMVISVGLMKDKEDARVLREMRDVVEAADERPVKVILETCLLTRDEIVRACGLVTESGARFVTTSTGCGRGGASVEDVALLREAVGPGFGVKAAGGICDRATAEAMVRAGANRLGSSSGVALVTG